MSECQVFIIGVNGQDGSYLAENLLAKGKTVIGVARQACSRYVIKNDLFRYHSLDLRIPSKLQELLSKSKPAQIYHLAAVHGASGYFYEDSWQDALHVNLGSVHTCLEYIRTKRSDARLLYASSLKAFGPVPPSVVSEASPRRSSCLYSITKNAASDLISHYRDRHGVRSTVLYLLNHDSPRRPAHYFLPRIAGILAASVAGESNNAEIHSLDFACDWGASREFMEIGAALLELDINQDYVLGTGITWRGMDLVRELFGQVGLDWRDHLKVAVPPGSEPVHYYKADLSRVQSALGMKPKQSALDVVRWILSVNHSLHLP